MAIKTTLADIANINTIFFWGRGIWSTKHSLSLSLSTLFRLSLCFVLFPFLLVLSLYSLSTQFPALSSVVVLRRLLPSADEPVCCHRLLLLLSCVSQPCALLPHCRRLLPCYVVCWRVIVLSSYCAHPWWTLGVCVWALSACSSLGRRVQRVNRRNVVVYWDVHTSSGKSPTYSSYLSFLLTLQWCLNKLRNIKIYKAKL